ncbi:MAG: Flp pilus assembly complex ATPase component TadA [Gammaproteobacteria bacterium]|nr:Flp pilus assembly complex ATPase component TadA [Gammaproteobacteria bacterium]
MDSIQLPFPPLSDIPPQQAYRPGEPVDVTLLDEQVFAAGLLAFKVNEALVTLRSSSIRGIEVKDIVLRDLKQLFVPQPRKLIRLPPSLAAHDGVVMPPPQQEFELTLRNGPTLRAYTFSFRVDKNGLHLFPTEANNEYRHLFVPFHAIDSHRIGPLLGNALLQERAASETAVAAGLEEQRRRREQPIGEYLQSVQAVSAKQMEQALDRQKQTPRFRVGEVLVQDGAITQEQLTAALHEQQQSRRQPLGDILVALGLADDGAVRQTLAKKLGVPFVDLQQFDVDQQLLKLVPEELARKHHAVPLQMAEGRLVVALADPMQWEPLEAMQGCSKLPVEAVMATVPAISSALDKHYGGRRADPWFTPPVVERATPTLADGHESIVRFVNNLLLGALRAQANGLHIRPNANAVDVLFRINGTLQLQQSLEKKMLAPVVDGIKLLAHMNIAEHERSQDGRLRFDAGDSKVDFRVSVIPTVNGESVVIRVLDAQDAARSLDDLGLRPHDLSRLKELLRRSAGIVLITGGAGSGKSSTLYAALKKLVERHLHIISVEEPIEVDVTGVEQIQVNNAAGYTFDRALRNILRHDPDVIAVGEILDRDTAKVALESAMTGQLVLSTLPTHAAAGAIGRLLEMEIEPYLLGRALLGVLAQRLVRRNCPHCLEPEAIAEDTAARLGIASSVMFYRSRGCQACAGSGTVGRVLLYEFLPMTAAVRQLINEKRPAAQICAQAVRDGMVEIEHHAVELAKAGVISLDQACLVKLA